jgi:chemotaxis protein methyltransferase CheR
MAEPTNEEIQAFISALKSSSEYDFSEYSIKSFTRRLEKISADNHMSVFEVIDKLKKDKNFLEETVKNITVNTTEIFRDPEVWIKIKKAIIPKYQFENEINIWHAGSSTGQEVYTVLIVLKQMGLFDKANIFATDLNTDVLEVAESGKYKYREIDEYIKNFGEAHIESEKYQLADYLEISRKRSLMKVKPFLLNKAVYAKHDLTSLKNPFEKKYHIIFCRNVLIYFNHDLQNKIFSFFLDNLVPGGTLVIGKHEGILGDIGNKFEKHGTIYVKK